MIIKGFSLNNNEIMCDKRLFNDYKEFEECVINIYTLLGKKELELVDMLGSLHGCYSHYFEAYIVEKFNSMNEVFKLDDFLENLSHNADKLISEANSGNLAAIEVVKYFLFIKIYSTPTGLFFEVEKKKKKDEEIRFYYMYKSKINDIYKDAKTIIKNYLILKEQIEKIKDEYRLKAA